MLKGYIVSIYKTKEFNKWAKTVRLTDLSLINAVSEMERGLIDANLGGNLYKKRVASSSGGKSGGFRTLIAYKKKGAFFFIYGFEKNARSNINEKEENALKEFAKLLLAYTAKELSLALKVGELIEVKNEKS
jgi:hypothetical protein